MAVYRHVPWAFEGKEVMGRGCRVMARSGRVSKENGGQVNVRVQQNHVARISYIDMIREYRQIN